MNHEITLKSLSAEINAKHTEAEKHAKKALTLALEVGESLIQAKQQVPHGQWQDWLKDNISFSKRKAQTYMRLANHKDEITKNAESALLSIDAALGLIAKEREPIRKEFDFRSLEASREWLEVIEIGVRTDALFTRKYCDLVLQKYEELRAALQHDKTIEPSESASTVEKLKFWTEIRYSDLEINIAKAKIALVRAIGGTLKEMDAVRLGNTEP